MITNTRRWKEQIYYLYIPSGQAEDIDNTLLGQITEHSGRRVMVVTKSFNYSDIGQKNYSAQTEISRFLGDLADCFIFQKVGGETRLAGDF